jgi:lysophospholipase
VSAKEDAGFNASLTDWWGRALSFQLVNATDGGPAYTFSSISEDTDFSNGNAPMPIIVADERAPGEQLISATATNLEFNPYEMGSFDPSLYGFVPLKYIGSRFEAGQLPQNEACIAGFDNAGFVMGTSSSLFNQFILNFDGVSGVPSIVKDAIKGLLQGLSKDDNDIADYTPNPFFHYNNKTNPSAETRRLTLVDGGEDGQNIPLNPLIQPVRAVDVIFAVDSSADTILNHNASAATNWPNGTSLVATYERSLNATTQNGTAFPAIPDMNTFVNLGLNNRPTFFGCNASNMTGHSPLIVYLPNTPYVYQSNTSTYQLQYNNTERNAIIQNGYDMATMGNGTVDKDWPTCVACAVLSRSFDRTGEKVPDACSQCFTKYCWNGTLAPQEPAPYFPSLKMADKKISVKGGVGRFAPNVFGLALVAAVSGALFI